MIITQGKETIVVRGSNIYINDRRFDITQGGITSLKEGVSYRKLMMKGDIK